MVCPICGMDIDANYPGYDEQDFVRTPIDWIAVVVKKKCDETTHATLFDDNVCSVECAREAMERALRRYDNA